MSDKLSPNTYKLQFPYFQGRFSNGPVAVEVLATGLGATLHDLAVAGAQTSTLGQLANTGMTSQLASFTASLGGGSADPNALYFVWGGANDLRAAGVNAAAAIAPTIVNLSTIVSSLYSLGARNFMLPNLPNL
ncbi:SGNH/GDSL hydrolase family protein, partial [Microcoleus sp. OTE_8_concoct_300]|uniref:SGNH/GDSL hydrolase family protein n=1 Tax=Microcoleus sp. OTE_8_concoct_300 TaxID=2964710 RepID=UPI00403F6C4E